MSEHLEKILAVQHMQDYINDHITEPMTLFMLAKAAGYSPWHSARIFKEVTGIAPFEYIRALRLSRAAAKLHDDKHVKVIDVAFDFVFDSHEGFTRAFSKQFGISPKEYRKHTPPINLFFPRAAHDYYLTRQKGERKMAKNLTTVFVQVVDRPARKLILKRGIKATHYFEFCEEVGCDVWNVLSSIKEALYEPIGMWMPVNLIKPGTSLYTQGVEVPLDYAGTVPDGFELIDLKPCKMMVFQGPPYDDEQFMEAISDVQEVLKSYSPERYGFQWADEDGPKTQLAPMGYRGYIEARPVRQLNSK